MRDQAGSSSYQAAPHVSNGKMTVAIGEFLLLHRAGYSSGLTQPSIKASLDIDCPPSVSFETLDEWLKNSFHIKLAEEPSLGFLPETSHQAIVAGLVWRMMNLGAALLRAVRVPAFEVGRILALQQRRSDPSKWKLTLLLPCVDYVPGSLLTHAYRDAARAVIWLLARKPAPESAERIFSMMNDGFLQKAHGSSFGGESTIAVLHEAWAKGIEFRHIGNGTYRLGVGAAQLRVDRGAVQFDSAIGAAISGNKWRTSTLMRAAGLPGPTHVVARSEEAALDIAHRLGWPVVVKPLDRDRGEGVTVNIRSDQQLVAAFRGAKLLSRSVLVERHVPGACHRVLVARGRVRVVAKWRPKSVSGDGNQTVRELVERSNADEQAKPPWLRLKPFPLDAMALECLSAAGFTPDSIPKTGEWAPLRPMQTMEWGGVVENLIDSIHPENAAIAVKAARVLGLSVAGIDIISPDITRPWHENGAIINEVNFSPMLTGRYAAPAIASLLEEWLPGKGRIPVEAVVGDAAAMDDGRRIRADYAVRGIRCWLTSHAETLTETGEATVVSASGLYGRCLALLTDPGVEALVMVIQTDELLETGLPVGRIDRIHAPDSNPSSGQSLRPRVQPDWVSAVCALLRAHALSNAAPRAARSVNLTHGAVGEFRAD